jgi:hypothetical protein
MFRDGRMAIYRWSLMPPSDLLMRIPDALLSGVAFICQPDPDGIGEPHYAGTAFLVAIPSEVDAGMKYNYIVRRRMSRMRWATIFI